MQYCGFVLSFVLKLPPGWLVISSWTGRVVWSFGSFLVCGWMVVMY